jgi:uncharacterized membrane protein
MEPVKELKRKGRNTVRHHYFLLVLVCLIAVFLGTEYNASGGLFSRIDSNVTSQTTVTNPLVKTDASAVFKDITSNNIKKGYKTSNNLMHKYKSGKDQSDFAGRTRGSLANVVNAMTSGQLYLKLASALNSITHSGKIVASIFVIVSFLFYLFIWIFFMNVYKVIMRRMFLEARTYEKVPLQHAIHLLAVHRWGRASITMFILYIFKFLWDLTIIGGFIKYYSYFLVPYIVAENPDIRPLEAITLSRKMMYGHKLECFKYQLSFIGWYALSICTFGLLRLVYLTPYEIATFSEYYSDMRVIAKENAVPGAERLNDEYLFVKAREAELHKAYPDIVEQRSYISEHEITINPFQKFIADFLGLWLGLTKTKNAYQDVQGLKYQIQRDLDALEGEAYPSRLNERWNPRHATLAGRIMFLRSYTIWNLLLMFFIFSFLGWCWEVSLHLINDGEFVNRGTMFGPWLPIYGCGGIIVLMLLSKLRTHPVAEFIGAIVLCGLVEYWTSYYLEMEHGMRWWDYTGYFMNLDGRICAEGLLVFAIAGMAIVYIIGPIMDMLLSRISMKIMIPLVLCLVVLFSIDSVHSSRHPNMGKGVTDYNAYKTTSAVEIINYHLC